MGFSEQSFQNKPVPNTRHLLVQAFALCTFCTKFDNMNFCFTNIIFKRKEMCRMHLKVHIFQKFFQSQHPSRSSLPDGVTNFGILSFPTRTWPFLLRPRSAPPTLRFPPVLLLYFKLKTEYELFLCF